MPAGLDAEVAAGRLGSQRRRAARRDAQQPVPVRAGAGAPAARLDAEQVVQQRDDEAMVQHQAITVHPERHDRQPGSIEVAEDLDVRVAHPPLSGPDPDQYSPRSRM